MAWLYQMAETETTLYTSAALADVDAGDTLVLYATHEPREQATCCFKFDSILDRLLSSRYGPTLLHTAGYIRAGCTSTTVAKYY